MDNFLTVARQVAILFALIGVGAICRKAKLVNAFSVHGFVNVLILVVTPALIVTVFQRPFDSAMLGAFALAFVVAALMHAVLILLSRVTAHGDARTLPVLRVATVFSNAGFMGIPLEQAILGAEGVFFGIVYVAMFNLFMWSWGLKTMKGSSSRRGLISLRTVVNPGTVGIAIGLPLFLCSVTLPDVLRRPVAMLSDLNTPLAMLVIGYYLAEADLRSLLRSEQAHLAVFVRLVVSPVLLILLFLPLRGVLDRTMMLALVTAAAAPVGAMVTMFASEFDRDVDLSVALVSGSTVLSVLTMPVVIAVAMHLL